eukprot:5576271-Alexandrium_andersonii.AAC.1
MSASLVGSEMCIRDRASLWRARCEQRRGSARIGAGAPCQCQRAPCVLGPVSYTHLTLPTICSV